MRAWALLAVLLATATGALAQSASPRIRGVLASVSDASIVVTTNMGPRTIGLDARTKIIGVVKASLSDVKPGSFIGTTVQEDPDGSIVSVEVHVFPPEMKGTGEGYRPMAASNTMMANATVQRVEAPSMMANATVRSVGARDGAKTVVLTYAGGSKTVVIPSNVPVVAFKMGTKALLVPGARVTVTAAQNGDALRAVRIQVAEGM